MDAPAGSADPETPLRLSRSPYPGRRSRICADFLARRGHIGAFFGPAHRDTAGLAALAKLLSTRRYPRAALATALNGFAREVQAPRSVEAQIARLGEPSAVTVFCGQQAGLFTGPLYTVYKALTVERWAADLEHRLGLPVVPCFWLADDDHDFDEVGHIELPEGGRPRRITYVPHMEPGGRPIVDLVVDGGMQAVFAALREVLPESRHTAAVLQDVEECYAADTGFSQAFARLWYRLFPESSLVFVSASNERVKQLSAPLLARSAVEHARLFELYEQDSRRLVALGYQRQVRKRPDQSFLFWQRGQRSGIVRDTARLYHVPGSAPATAAQLGELVLQHPRDFSANVLLRPLVQNTLFPVLGVVLGPSELAYHAQIPALHDHFDVPRPAVLPRTSATLLDRHAAHHVEEMGLNLQALGLHREGERARVLARGFPSSVDAGFRRAAAEIEATLRELGDELGRVDADMARVFCACARRARRELDRAAGKARAIHRRRQVDTAARIDRLAAQLVPSGEPQERCFNILFYYARYGPELMQALHRQWPGGGADHWLLLPQ